MGDARIPVVLGIGFSQRATHATFDALRAQAEAAIAAHLAQSSSMAAAEWALVLAVPAHRAKCAVLAAWLSEQPLAHRLVPADALRNAAPATETQAQRSNPVTGTASMAEAAALAAAGPAARLLIPRFRCDYTTGAVAVDHRAFPAPDSGDRA